MTSELDIYRAANVLIDRHGEDAVRHATARASELVAAGEVDGGRTWQHIVLAVHALRRGRMPGEPVH